MKKKPPQYRSARQQNRGFNLREKRAFRRLLLAAFILSVFFFLFAPNCSLYSYYTLQEKSNRLAEENRRLLKETAELKKEIELLEYDKAYLEKVAREKYGLLKKDEEVYYLHPQAKKE